MRFLDCYAVDGMYFCYKTCFHICESNYYLAKSTAFTTTAAAALLSVSPHHHVYYGCCLPLLKVLSYMNSVPRMATYGSHYLDVGSFVREW